MTHAAAAPVDNINSCGASSAAPTQGVHPIDSGKYRISCNPLPQDSLDLFMILSGVALLSRHGMCIFNLTKMVHDSPE